MCLTVKKVMTRLIGISLVAVLMAVQLLFLYTRYLIQDYDMMDYPRMSLPVASHAARYSGGGHYENISWTQKGGWVLSGIGKVKDQDLDHYFRDAVERSRGRNEIPGMRVRIPANAPAAIFVNLAKRMEKAGVVQVRVAVFEQRVPRR
jgi:hypothetical protein